MSSERVSRPLIAVGDGLGLNPLSGRVWESATTSCVEFQGHVNEHGYGRLWWPLMGCNWYAHRVAASFREGRVIGPREVVCHVCDNRLCCNPDHLIVGTLALNAQDMHAKGRGRGTYASRKLTADDVTCIRRCLDLGHGVIHLADRFGVAEQTIRDVRDQRTWRGLVGVLPQKPLFDPWESAS